MAKPMPAITTQQHPQQSLDFTTFFHARQEVTLEVRDAHVTLCTEHYMSVQYHGRLWETIPVSQRFPPETVSNKCLMKQTLTVSAPFILPATPLSSTYSQHPSKPCAKSLKRLSVAS